ncbi:aminopeptidase [Novisyntrophococcus fermenticellae]|uniref:aminopeptidase n=1 Tax=Novisyntrophococcus fermenticellae TaxID=2068655 RepID=UPI001E544350|nr:aminopeptidase [Novisyntrophococcus fermenticellae]
MSEKNVWNIRSESELARINTLAEDYKEYISQGKTERRCVDLAVMEAEKRGFISLEDKIRKDEALKPGDKVYAHCMKKSLLLAVIGQEPIENGMNILGAHIDSPRLDLKQNPLYEDTGMALLDTHYYGGIKKYQWVTIPLAIYGVVIKKDGSTIQVEIGDKEGDPVFCITDLLVHLAGEQMEKKAKEVIEGEGLDILIGSQPEKDADKDAVKRNILKLLKDKYNIEEDDFLSAEIEIVPAGKARDCGLDRSMIMGYGQDDRVCAYTSLMALLEAENLSRTGICLLADKEEVGSVGATGMHSHFFENTIAEIMNLTGEYSELSLRRALRNCFMLSSDVSAAFDPNYAASFEKKNSAYFGKGLVFNKYTGARGKSGCNDANAEYLAKLRKVMDDEGILFQTSELGKVDVGGGGTIAYILANYGMEVIDSGIALLNMHAPWEISSKADIYEAYKGYGAFLTHMR